MNEDKQVNAIPAGSLPIDEENSAAAGARAQADDGKAAAAAEETPILGKFKTQEELTKAYQDLEKDHGRLGTEVGNLRKQTEFQQKQNELILNKLGNAQPDKNVAAPDFDAQLNELASKVESGDIDIATALKQSTAITEKKLAVVMDQKLSQVQTQTHADKAKEQFLQKYPDFNAVVQSGLLEPIKADNPIHDNVTAYLELKRQEAVVKGDAAIQEALERGKQEGAKLTAGANAASQVLGKTGASTRAAINPKPSTEGERLEGMAGVLAKVRGG